MWIWVAWIAAGFFLGSIPFSYLLPKIIMNRDICALSSDGNPGAGNAFTYCGVWMGSVCLVLDLAKGFVPVFFAIRALNWQSIWFALVLSAPAMGHALGLFRNGKGGKSIAAIFGSLLGVLPFSWVVFILAAVYVFFSTIWKINPHRRRSLVSFAVFWVGSVARTLYAGQLSMAAGCSMLSLIGLWKHLKPIEPTTVTQKAQEGSL